MQDIKLLKPSEATTYPSPFINPAQKDKNYHLQSAKAIYWTGWQTYNNAYGNYYRNTWLDNRLWARGTQSNIGFAQKPPAKNDHTKNPLLKHINFNAVNEMVKYCDIFVTMLEQSDLDITATAINPAAAAKRAEIKAQAQAYQELKPFYDQLNEQSGQQIAPQNPMDREFDTQQELEMFFQVAFKLKQELLVELGNETVLNDSDWKTLRKMFAEDVRDTGYIMSCVESDTNCKIRAKYIDPINSGWEDFRGHKVKHLSRFWTIEVMTGAQIVAESGGQLTPKELYDMATMSAGKYGNPMMSTNAPLSSNFGYINSDSTYNMWFYDNWKFPVLRCWWEDWDVYKYMEIKRSIDGVRESYSPVEYNAPEGQIKDSEGEQERLITIQSSHLHHYRQCKWVIGTEVCYNFGLVPNCPRDPRDVRFALSPIKIYRATGAPLAQRLKAIAQVGQNAWYKFQNEIARARPSGVTINIRAIDNVTTIEGRKLNRYHVLELFNEEGTLLYSDRGGRDDLGNTNSSEPIKQGVPADINAMQRWINVINECSYRMQMESGLNEFAVSATQNPEQSATAVKAGVASANKSIQQYVDAMLITFEDIAIDITGKLKELIRNGKAEVYYSSIGEALLQMTDADSSITIYDYGIRVTARPTYEQRQELKLEIRKAFAGLGTPTEGSPYLPDLLELEGMIDAGVNTKVIAVYASFLQSKNMKELQAQKERDIQLNTQSQQAIVQSSSQAKREEEKFMSQLRMQEKTHSTNEDIRLSKAQSVFKTENQITTNADKSVHKANEKVLEATLGG